MEKPLYPSLYMRITQGYNTGTHLNSYAIDEAGKDSQISILRAPFTGIIKKIYKEDANEVWLESVEPVEYPDGTIDYMTILFAHSNDISNLYVGKKINQGEQFYSEGTKGNATGVHCHIQISQSRDTTWKKNNYGNYCFNNEYDTDACYFVDDTNVINGLGGNWKKQQI